MSHGTHEAKRPTMPALVLGLAFVAAGGPAFGGSGWPGHGLHHGKFWEKSKVCRKLQLTDDEVRTLESIFSRKQQTLSDLERDVERKKDDLDTLLALFIADGRADEQKVLAQVDQLEQARDKLGKARVTMLLEMRNVLTPGQRATLARLREKHHDEEEHDHKIEAGG